MEYTVVIRTLGTAGEKYQQELNSLCNQTLPPKEILVYIAEGYPLPKETCGKERYIYVKKGMVAQRALRYDEVKTDYVLFLDDDVYLAPDSVEHLFAQMSEHGADVISPNTFCNFEMQGKARLLNQITGKLIPFKNEKWLYKVARTGGSFYNEAPAKSFYWSESNAGPCFLCKKTDFLGIHFEEELWLDETPYALPEDQVMFYKMHLNGLRVATSMDSGIVHLDAGSGRQFSEEKEQKLLYSEVRNQVIFWHRFIKPYNKGLKGIWAKICVDYYKNMRRLFALRNKLKGDSRQFDTIQRAIGDAESYIESVK